MNNNAVKPIVAVKKDERTGDISLVQYAWRKSLGARVGWGSPKHYSVTEFRNTGLDHILESLHEFHSRDGDDPSMRAVLPVEERTKFNKYHLSLVIGLEDDSTLVLTPSR